MTGLGKDNTSETGVCVGADGGTTTIGGEMGVARESTATSGGALVAVGVGVCVAVGDDVLVGVGDTVAVAVGDGV